MKPDKSLHKEAFERYASKIAEFNSVEEIILFGSVARNDHGTKSDVDVFIKVRDLSERDAIEREAFNVSLEKNVSITPIIKQKEPKDSLMEDIRDEGIKYVRS